MSDEAAAAVVEKHAYVHDSVIASFLEWVWQASPAVAVLSLESDDGMVMWEAWSVAGSPKTDGALVVYSS